MRDFFRRQPPINWLLGLLIAVCFQLLISWAFVRLVHYKAQHRYLPKGSFTVEVITEDDYKLLSDRTLDEVKLSNGTTVSDRQPVFYEVALPNYVRSGDHYVSVTSLGTASYYYLWLKDFLPLLLLSCIALVMAFREQRRQFPLEKKQPVE